MRPDHLTGCTAGPLPSSCAMPSGGRRARAGWLALLALVMAVLSAFPVVSRLRGGSAKDYGLWFGAGRIAAAGGDLYPRGGVLDFPFMYPPTAAALLAPLSVLGELPLIIILVLLNSAAWAVTIWLSAALAAPRDGPRHLALYVVPSACCLFFVYDTYFLGQPNLLLLACLLGAFACLRRGHEFSAGALVAFAAALKAFPA